MFFFFAAAASLRQEHGSFDRQIHLIVCNKKKRFSQNTFYILLGPIYMKRG